MADSWFFKIILVLLVFSFGALFNVSDLVGRFSADKTVLTIGGEKISSHVVAARISERLDMLQKSTGQQITLKKAMEAGLINQILQEMVQDKLLTLEADRLGLVVTDKAVSLYVQTAPAMKKEDGTFDRARFDHYLSNIHMTESQFINKTRQDLVREQLLTLLDTKPVLFPAQRAAYVHHYATVRFAQTVMVKSADQKVGNAPEDQLKDLYKKEVKALTVQEARDFELITIDPAIVAESVKVDEVLVNQEYGANKQDYMSAETRKVTLASYASEAAAQKALKALKDGGALKKSQNGRLEKQTVTQGEKTPVAQIAFATAKGDFSKPFALDNRWVIVTVTGITPGAAMGESEAKKTIRQNLIQKAAAQKVEEIATQIQDAFSGGATAEEVAAKFHLKRTVHTQVDPLNKKMESQLLKAVFELEPDQETQPLDGGNGKLVIAKLIKITPSAVKPFESAKADLQTLWQQREREKLAQSAARTLMEKVAKGTPLKVAAKAQKLSVVDKKLNRYEAIKSKDRNQMVLADVLFHIPAVNGVDVAPQESGFMVVQYVKGTPAVGASKELTQGIDTMLMRNIGGDAPDQFMAYLSKKYPVKVDEKALQALLKE